MRINRLCVEIRVYRVPRISLVDDCVQQDARGLADVKGELEAGEDHGSQGCVNLLLSSLKHEINIIDVSQVGEEVWSSAPFETGFFFPA